MKKRTYGKVKTVINVTERVNDKVMPETEWNNVVLKWYQWQLKPFLPFSLISSSLSPSSSSFYIFTPHILLYSHNSVSPFSLYSGTLSPSIFPLPTALHAFLSILALNHFDHTQMHHCMLHATGKLPVEHINCIIWVFW